MPTLPRREDAAPPASGRRGPSMADVAREAGVSGQTVSRVSNGRSNVDEATRRRVLAAMQKIGYRPNSAARALRSGRFRTIGVIMAVVSALLNFAFIAAYPFWSTIVIALDVFIIMALTVHGRDIESA